jgi:hypothetical protein
VQAYASGGTAPYTYSWDGGVTFGNNSTVTVTPGSSGYVVIQDSFTGTGGPRTAIARWKVAEKPRLKIIYDKINFCEAAEPDLTGQLIIKGLENALFGIDYNWELTQLFNAQNNQPTNTVVASGTFQVQNIINNGNYIATTGLTPGSYLLTVTPQGYNCPVNVRFTICNDCSQVSSDHPDQQGGCGCCGSENCTDDTHVNIDRGF